MGIINPLNPTSTDCLIGEGELHRPSVVTYLQYFMCPWMKLVTPWFLHATQVGFFLLTFIFLPFWTDVMDGNWANDSVVSTDSHSIKPGLSAESVELILALELKSRFETHNWNNLFSLIWSHQTVGKCQVGVKQVMTSVVMSINLLLTSEIVKSWLVTSLAGTCQWLTVDRDVHVVKQRWNCCTWSLLMMITLFAVCLSWKPVFRDVQDASDGFGEGLAMSWWGKANSLMQCSKWKFFLSSEMALFLKNNMKQQVFWPFGHVPVVSADSMTTDLEHCYVTTLYTTLFQIFPGDPGPWSVTPGHVH